MHACLLPGMRILFSHTRVEGSELREGPLLERNPEMTEHGQDEILELLWTLREQRKASRAEVLRSSPEPGPERLLEELVAGGMVDASGEEILLTKSGEDRARGIIRRHRLAEVLLQNLFDLDDTQLENSACPIEHT